MFIQYFPPLLHAGTNSSVDKPDRFLNMSSNEAYVVSIGHSEETENNEYYTTIPEESDGDAYDYVDKPFVVGRVKSRLAPHS